MHNVIAMCKKHHPSIKPIRSTNFCLKGLFIFPTALLLVTSFQGFSQSDVFTPLFSISSESEGLIYFEDPQDVAVDTNGNSFVVDKSLNRITKIDPNGNFLRYWGAPGNGPGEFTGPQSIAVDTANQILVLDAGNHRIQKFDSEGNFILEFGSQGTGNGQFSESLAITTDQNGVIYVSEGDLGARIQLFDLQGNYLGQFGESVLLGGDISTPTGMAIAENGNLLVADGPQASVLEFNANGELVQMISSYQQEGLPTNPFIYPIDVTVGNNGNIFILDFFDGAHRLISLTKDFIFSAIYFVNGGASLSFGSPTGIAANSKNNNRIYLTDAGRGKLIRFTSGLSAINEIGTNDLSGPGILGSPAGVAISNNSIYVSDPDNQEIKIYNASDYSYTGLSIMGVQEGPGQLIEPGKLGVSDAGDVFVLDGQSSVKKFRPDRTFVDSLAAAATQTFNGIHVGNDGTFFVTRRTPEENELTGFQGFDSNFNLSLSSSTLDFIAPQGITRDRNGFVYVSDTSTNSIKVYNPANNYGFRLSFDEPGIPPFSFGKPLGLTIDHRGNILVADTDNHRILKYNSQGEFMFAYGSLGSLQGEFNYPVDIKVDSTGRVFVADKGNQRIQVLQTCQIIDTEHRSICSGESTVFEGTTYNEAGEYDRVFVSNEGCDSIRRLILMVVDPIQIDTSFCRGDTLAIKGNIITEPGDYSFSISNPDGCDTTLQVNANYYAPYSLGDLIDEVNISCDQDLSTIITQEPAIQSTCNVPFSLSSLDSIVSLDTACMSYDIYRIWTATDTFGVSEQWKQLIKVRPKHNYTLRFPKDELIQASDIPEIRGVDFTDSECDLVAVSYQDDVFPFASDPNACFKIFRTYTVINWCQYQDGDPGVVVSREWDNWNYTTSDSMQNINPQNPSGNGIPGDSDLFLTIASNPTDFLPDTVYIDSNFRHGEEDGIPDNPATPDWQEDYWWKVLYQPEGQNNTIVLTENEFPDTTTYLSPGDTLLIRFRHFKKFRFGLGITLEPTIGSLEEPRVVYDDIYELRYVADELFTGVDSFSFSYMVCTVPRICLREASVRIEANPDSPTFVPTGKWTYTQHVEIIDNEPPAIEMTLPDTVCTYENDNCNESILINLSLSDQLSITNSHLSIDHFSDGSINQDFSLNEGMNSLEVSLPQGTHQVQVIVTDQCGNTNTHTQSLTVLGYEVFCREEVEVLLGTECDAIILPDELAYGNIQRVNSIVVLDNNPSDGPRVTEVGAFSYALFDVQNDVLCSGHIEVVDKTPPEIFCVSTSVTLDEFGEATVVTDDIIQSVTDNCSSLNIPFLSQTDFTASDVGSNTVVVKVYDYYLNQASCTVTIEVIDATPPVALCQSKRLYLNEAGEGRINPGYFDAGSYDNSNNLIWSASRTAFSMADTGLQAITLTVRDASNNESQCQTMLEVIAPGCLPSIAFDKAQILDGSYRSNGDITHQYAIQSTSEVSLRGAAINLLPGFEAPFGSRFSAAAVPCQIEFASFRPIIQKSNPKAGEHFTASIFPTLIFDRATIQVDLYQSTRLEIFLSNSLGQIIRQFGGNQKLAEGTYTYELERGSLPAGLYFVQIKSDDHATVESVFMK